MQIRYDTIDKDGKVNEIVHPCFAPIQNTIHTFKEVKFYICKDYRVSDILKLCQMNLNLTIDEIKIYTKLLKRMGFKFKISYSESTWHHEYERKINRDSICFTIDTANNSFLVSRILTNALRHIAESNSVVVIKTFLELVKIKESKLNNFSRLLLAIDTCRGHAGHNMRSNGVYSWYTDEELKEKVLNCTKTNTWVNQILKVLSWDNYRTLCTDLYKLNEEKKYEELLKLYEQEGYAKKD